LGCYPPVTRFEEDLDRRAFLFPAMVCIALGDGQAPVSSERLDDGRRNPSREEYRHEILYAEPDKTLSGVAAFLSDPSRTQVETLERMLTASHLSGGPHPAVAEVAREMLNKSANELSGVYSTAVAFLGLYRDPVIARNTAESDFRILSALRIGRPLFRCRKSDLQARHSALNTECEAGRRAQARTSRRGRARARPGGEWRRATSCRPRHRMPSERNRKAGISRLFCVWPAAC